MITFLSHELFIRQSLASEDIQAPNYEFHLSDKGADAGEQISKTKVIGTGRANSEISLFGVNSSGLPILTNDMTSSARAIWKFKLPTSEELHIEMAMDVFQASGSAKAHLSWKLEQGEAIVATSVIDFPTQQREFKYTASKSYMLEADLEYTLSLYSKCDALEDAGINICSIRVSIEEERDNNNDHHFTTPQSLRA